VTLPLRTVNPAATLPPSIVEGVAEDGPAIVTWAAEFSIEMASPLDSWIVTGLPDESCRKMTTADPEDAGFA
jgi:hypothetical protein